MKLHPRRLLRRRNKLPRRRLHTEPPGPALPLTLVTSRGLDAKTWVFEGIGGKKPYMLDPGDGSAPIQISKAVAHTYAEFDAYTVTLTDAEGTQVVQNITVDQTIPPLEIVYPADGAQMESAVYDIIGHGAAAGVEVMLWNVDKKDPATDTPNATVISGQNGVFTFLGSHAAYGTVTWAVTSGGEQSPPVVVTAPEQEAA